MIGIDIALLESAHRLCANHRATIESSALCGCFYCRTTFEAKEVTEWVDDEQTALCPKCGIDSVLGDSAGSHVTDAAFLEEMHRYWFEEPRSIH